MPRHYTLNGKGHSILRHLSRAPASLKDLQSLLGIDNAPKPMVRLRRVLAALTDDLLIVHGCGVYRLRDPGRVMLDVLDRDLASHEAAAPSVRVFGERRAAA